MREMSGDSARQKATRKGAFHEVALVTLMGALLSSGKDSSSSLWKTKRSIITHPGKGAADMVTLEQIVRLERSLCEDKSKELRHGGALPMKKEEEACGSGDPAASRF
ncbi:hypothetical protein ZWY2020_050435 [Hordeum vulgare]|nr:hypothetical protein ZWY2020_050435 [Hordeum vulgare]